jgi:uncharacterized protein
MPMSREEIEAFLIQPNIAVVAVTAPDGAPHAVPTWYEYDRGEIVFQTSPTAFKYKCLKHDPRVTLCVDTKQAPYKAVVLKGRATMVQQNDEERLLRMAIHYLGPQLGKVYAESMKGQPTVVVRFKPQRISSWDYRRDV